MKIANDGAQRHLKYSIDMATSTNIQSSIINIQLKQVASNEQLKKDLVRLGKELEELKRFVERSISQGNKDF